MDAAKQLAFANVDLLRAILGAGPDATITSIGAVLGRDQSNTSKTVNKLVEGGYLARDPLGLTVGGLAIIEADDVASGRAAAPSPAGLMSLTHADIAPNPANDRKDWTSEDALADLQALATDIHANGLLQNLVVRPNEADGPPWILVGGERRWRAIGQLIAEGSIPPDFAIPVRRLDADEVGLRLAALSENLQRRALNPIEEAHAYRGLREAGLTTDQIAEKVSVTQRHVQGRLQLLDLLSEADQARMTLPKDDPQHLGVKAARELVQNAEAKRAAREKAEAEYSPRQRLIIAEMRIAAGDWYGNQVQVHPERIAGDPDATALDKAGLLDVPDSVDSEGAAKAKLRYIAFDTIKALGLGDYSGSKEGTAAARVYADQLRAELGLTAPDGGYAIDWLNGPFEISLELQARIDAGKAEREQRDAQWKAEREAADRQRAEEEAARKEAWKQARTIADGERALQANHPTAKPQADRVQQAALQIEHPLPWAPNARGQLIDANGDTVRIGSIYYGEADDGDMALATLVCLAVNSAGELATPAEPALPLNERPLSREAFEAKLAEEIAELAEARPFLQGLTATKLLDEYLDGEGIDYGAPDYGWTESDAFTLVEEYDPEADDPQGSCETCGEEHPEGVLQDGLCPACVDREDHSDAADKDALEEETA